jgi:hypothetical protein
MTEPFRQSVTVHGLVSGLGIGDLNKDMWEPLPFEPLVGVAAAPAARPTPLPTTHR